MNLRTVAPSLFGLAFLGAVIGPPLVGIGLGLSWGVVVAWMVLGVVGVQVAERMVASRLTPATVALQCSFCGRSQQEVKKLIAGPAVYICDGCIALCVDIIADEDAKAEEAAPIVVKPQEDVWSPPDRDT